MIAILDYGVGNLGSIRNMLKKMGHPSVITSDPREIEAADKLILPGVGHFSHCMSRFVGSEFYTMATDKVLVRRTPILCICVGCQMLMEHSEEGDAPGLGWIKGDVVRFDPAKAAQPIKIPHMGWTDVCPRPGNPLFLGIENPRFYFVHSYHLRCQEKDAVAGESVYGYPFAAAVQKGNIFGVQFHPEKSHRFGMRLLENFSSLGG
jgi:glutamine amidotransferase